MGGYNKDTNVTEVVIAQSKEKVEDEEERKARAKKKELVNVYLQVPYKVKTYMELKNKAVLNNS